MAACGFDPQTDLKDTIKDILVDVGHLCDAENIDFVAALKRAINTWAVERIDPASFDDGSAVEIASFSGFRALFLAGERADPPTLRWAEKHLNVPVIDHWWQTETGWVICGNPAGLGLLPVKHGSPSVPMPGFHLEVLDENASRFPPAKMGPWQSGCRSRLAAFRRSGTPTIASAEATFRHSRAITRRPTRGSAMATGMFMRWRAPMTSSTSRATASRRARLKK